MKWKSFRKRKTGVIIPILWYFESYTPAYGAPCKLDFWMQVTSEGWVRNYLKLKEFETIRDELARIAEQEVPKFVKKSRSTGQKLLRFCREELPRLNRREGYKGFAEHYKKYAAVNNPWWVFDVAEKLLENTDHDKALTNVQSYAFDYKIAILEVALGKLSKEEFLKEWFWFPFDYTGPALTKEKLEEELKNFNNPRAEYEQILQERAEREEALRRAEEKLAPMLRKKFSTVRFIMQLQDEKKKVTTEAHYHLQQFFKRVADGQNFHDYYFFLPKEFLNRKNPLVGERKRFSVTILKEGEAKILSGSAARDFLEECGLSNSDASREVLEGKGAYPGKVQGNARIILNQEDFAKLKEGEILITTMTTPNFLPVMESAVAFVTDEGGVTCHAAIVAREMRKPCVIGTGNATSVFKDGDLVEVDAEKGVVRKL